MSEAVIPFDLQRMVLGNAPPLFLLEIIVRTAIVYAYSIVLIRWVGGRGIAQMSVVEFLLVIALGSAVGDSMFYPEVPVLHALLVISVVVLINKALDRLVFRSRAAERLLDGFTREIVGDGILRLGELDALNLGRSEGFEALRENGIANLGEVRQAYMESSGRISVFRARPGQPGLPLVPAWAVTPPACLGPHATVSSAEGPACVDCGAIPPAKTVTPDCCPVCGGSVWIPARMPGRDPC
jgi:hypothetical protein